MDPALPSNISSSADEDSDDCVLCLCGKGTLIRSDVLFVSRACACVFYVHPSCLTELYRHDLGRVNKCVLCSLPHLALTPREPDLERAQHEETLRAIYSRANGRLQRSDMIAPGCNICVSVAMLFLAGILVYLIVLGIHNQDEPDPGDY